MQLTIFTERGTFKSKRHDNAPAEEMKTLKDLLQQSAADGNYFTLDTDAGYVVLGKELLRTAAFVVDV
jgi:hypothetical protein